MKFRILVTFVAVLALSLTLLGRVSSAWGVATTLISNTASGAQGNNNSSGPAISANGRYVTFTSLANNLFEGDTNNIEDVFVVDLQTRAVCHASQATDGTHGNSRSNGASYLSADGRYVVFASQATNLVPLDTNGVYDDFLHDCQTGLTERVSVGEGWTQANATSGAPAINADGRYVAFDSIANNLANGDVNASWDVFVRDRTTLHTYIVSMSTGGLIGNSSSSRPAISADGNRVAFYSAATNLVESDTNGAVDVFVRDRAANTTIRVSVNLGGGQATSGVGTEYTPSISADGNLVAFYSGSTNLVDGDTNAKNDIFVKNLTTGEVIRASVDSSGVQANNNSLHPALSPDGRYVIYESYATNLVPGDTNASRDVFVHDLQTHTTIRASSNQFGAQGNADSFWPGISNYDGVMKAVYQSNATNLVRNDTNAAADVFVSTPAPLLDKNTYIPIVVRQ